MLHSSEAKTLCIYGLHDLELEVSEDVSQCVDNNYTLVVHNTGATTSKCFETIRGLRRTESYNVK